MMDTTSLRLISATYYPVEQPGSATCGIYWTRGSNQDRVFIIKVPKQRCQELEVDANLRRCHDTVRQTVGAHPEVMPALKVVEIALSVDQLQACLQGQQPQGHTPTMKIGDAVYYVTRRQMSSRNVTGFARDLMTGRAWFWKQNERQVETPAAPMLGISQELRVSLHIQAALQDEPELQKRFTTLFAASRSISGQFEYGLWPKLKEDLLSRAERRIVRGDGLRLVTDRASLPSHAEQRHLTMQLLDMLKGLRLSGVIHQDFCLENVLCRSRVVETPELALHDFEGAMIEEEINWDAISIRRVFGIHRSDSIPFRDYEALSPLLELRSCPDAMTWTRTVADSRPSWADEDPFSPVAAWVKRYDIKTTSDLLSHLDTPDIPALFSNALEYRDLLRQTWINTILEMLRAREVFAVATTLFMALVMLKPRVAHYPDTGRPVPRHDVEQQRLDLEGVDTDPEVADLVLRMLSEDWFARPSITELNRYRDRLAAHEDQAQRSEMA